MSVVLATLLSLPLLAQAPPSADAFVSSAYPTTNFGVVNSLAVGPGSTSYIQFNLSGIPAGATVSKASLRLYVDLVTKAGKFDVYQVTKNWSENTLTYNSQPLPLGASLTGGAGVSITAASCNQFLLIDVTPQVQSWLTSPDTNKGLALSLVSGSSGNFFFDAKESLLTANGPELELALSSVGPQGPPGPQGATGAQGPAGLQGPPGIDGAQGSQGPAGPKGPAGLTWRGPFDCNGTYAVGDVVSYQGESWVDANLPIGGCVQPPFDPWQLLAQKGTDGPQGLQGQQGPIGLQGPQGATGLQGAQGAAGSQGPTGPVGPDGPQGPPGPGGFNGMKEFSSATLVDPYIWLAPPNVTHVLVEMWGGGGGGGSLYGGGGGAYSRSVVAVTPGATYEIRVGAGGAAAQPGQSYGRSGGDSSMSVLGGSDLIHATGGAYTGSGGFIDFRADIARSGLSLNGFGGGAAFGAQFCPGPYLETTGHGGDPLQGGIAGYVLLTW